MADIKRKNVVIVLLSILAVVLIGASVLCITQWDNIQSVSMGLKYTPEEIEALQHDAKKKFEEKTGIDLKKVEEMSKFINPDGSPKEIVPEGPTEGPVPDGVLEGPGSGASAEVSASGEPVIPSSPGDAPSETDQSEDSVPDESMVVDKLHPKKPVTAPEGEDSLKSNKPSAPGKTASNSENSITPQNDAFSGESPAKAPGNAFSGRDTSDVESIMARFYSLQSSFVSQIEGIKTSTISTYKALPKENRNLKVRTTYAHNAVLQASALESQCDAQVAGLLAELSVALKEAGMDESLVEDVRYYYASEKSYIKASYMSKFAKYL